MNWCWLLGHKFPDVKLGGSLFRRVDCERKGCDYAMDAVAYKAVLDALPEGPLRDTVARKGPGLLGPDE